MESLAKTLCYVWKRTKFTDIFAILSLDELIKWLALSDFMGDFQVTYSGNLNTSIKRDDLLLKN